MAHFSLPDLDAALTYKLISGALIPRPIAWISTQNKDGATNAAPYSFFNALGGSYLAVSIGRTEDGFKDTAKNLLETKEAVIHLTDLDNVDDMNKTSATLPPETSEIEAFGLGTVPSATVGVPGLANAKVRFEARLHQHIPLGKGDAISHDLFILDVTDIHLADEIFDAEKQYILPKNLKPVARLSGNTYAELSNYFDLKRPM